jgi:hypothetical protein
MKVNGIIILFFKKLTRLGWFMGCNKERALGRITSDITLNVNQKIGKY